MKKIKRMTCGLLPLLAGAAVLIEHYTVPNAQAVSGTLPVFIGILMCGVLILTLLSIQSSSVLNWLRDRSAWYGYFSDFSCAGRSNTENRHLWSAHVSKSGSASCRVGFGSEHSS